MPMYLFYSTSCVLMIMLVSAEKGEHFPPSILTLSITMKGVPRIIQLTRIDRVLANEFLPVWITSDNERNEIEKLNIMNKIGEFTTYHDKCSKSAIVYFHDRLEIDGVIDVTFYIKGQPIDETKDVHEVETKYLHHSRNDRWFSNLEQIFHDSPSTERRRDIIPTIYPELLIAINHETYEAIEEDSDLSRGIATVSHIITVYNAADMLFSLMILSNIQLNIAGILIEGVANQWNFESRMKSGFSLHYHIEVTPILSKISKYFWLRQHLFPRHSYDIIMYHTRSKLWNSKKQEIEGRAHFPTIDDYMFPPTYHKDRLGAVIKDFATYRHYINIVHEIAHMFSATHDGEGEFGELFDMKTCGNTLMAPFSICSKSCLQWSSQTEAEIADHLRRPAYCSLMNYPRSLVVPRPRIIFSANEQCECYGHQPTLRSEENIPKNECRRPLKCINEANNKVVEVPLPMDGTPCGFRRVCWNGACRILRRKDIRGMKTNS